MPLILGANSVSGGYSIANSLRLNRASSDYLNRTPSSAGSTTKGTFSIWFKLSETTASRSGAYLTYYNNYNPPNWFFISIDTDEYLHIAQFTSPSSYVFQLVSTQLFRDYSAWYHLVVAIDTTQGTASNRVRAYLNGSEITSWQTQTNPSSSASLVMFNNSLTNIGRYNTSSQYTSGYIAENYVIDNQQLDPSYFGETDEDSGLWIPKAYTGSFGTNGFYLKFANSASLGVDSSGNGNNFTVNNLTSVDQTTDTPTNNFATLNPLNNNTSATSTFSEGNLKLVTDGNGGSRSSIAVSSGKWYCEIKCVSNTAWNGVTDVSQYINNEYTTNSVALYTAGATLYVGGVNQGSGGYGSTWTANDIMNLALDLDSGTKKIYFGKNGGWWNGSTYGASSPTTSVTLTNDVTYAITVGSGSGTSTNELNFGNPPYSGGGYTDGAGYGNFSYAVPSGYYSLCTKNLANYG